jgi:hypothetical protein
MFPSSSPFSSPSSQNATGFFHRSGGGEPSGVPAPGQPAPAINEKSQKNIHTMPGKFFSRPGKTSGGNRVLQIVVIVLAIVLCAGGVLLYLRYTNERDTTNTNQQNANVTTNANGNVNRNANGNANGNVNANTNTNTSAPEIVKNSLTDPTTNEKISSVTLTVPAGAVPANTAPIAITALSANVGAYAGSEKYQAVGAVYIITPALTKLSKDATIEISYADSELLKLGFVVEERDLVIASWSQTEWVPLNSLVDTKENLITTNIDQFFTDGIAVVAPKPAAGNANANANTNATTNTNSSNGTIVPSLDSDADSLTNQEEILYGTNAGSADTDLDGYKDGQEVLALYNPNGTGRLVASSLVKTYENTTYRYSILTPPSWTVGTLNADKNVVFTATTGEFIQVSVQENANALSAREWYLALNPSVNQSEIRDIAVNGIAGILGPDGLNVFFADATSIYQVTYNIGIRTEANYLTTFTMMYTSFLTGIPVSGANTNTSANANANTNATPANSNTNTAQNTNGGGT